MDYQRDATKRVRIALVGAGMHAYRNLLPVLTFLPVELVAVADVDLGLAERTARQYGVRAYASATEMYASAEQGDRIAVVGYKKAFMPATVKVLELTEQDDLYTILATFPMAVPSGDGEGDPGQQQAAANWLANGCHPPSFLVRFAGPVTSVAVHRGRDSSGVLVLRHRSGALSNLHLALGGPFSQPFERYTVYAEDTTIAVENSRRVIYQRGVPMGTHTETFAPPGLGTGAVVWESQDNLSTFECRAEVTQGLYGGLAHFVACVLAGTKPETADLTFARQLAALHAAAIVSTGDTVEIGDHS